MVNYDLPWNPQGIGRCHRYGQKHEVAVINFLNGRPTREVLAQRTGTETLFTPRWAVV